MARLLLDQGYRVVGTSRDAQTANFGNLDRLGIRARVALASMVLTDFRSTLQTLAKIAPDELYNLAGQTSVGLSFEQPVETLESIATGTLNLLEAIRFLERPIRLYNAGSSECFGDTGGVAATEVLLALFSALGPAMLGRLRGMFAFAIWDAWEQSLFRPAS